MDHGKQFQLFASVFIVERVIDDEDPAFFFRSERSDEKNDFPGQECEKVSPVVSGRIEESVGRITFKGKGIFFSGRASPEISLAKNENEQCRKDLKERNPLLFLPATSSQSLSKRDGFPESRKFGQGLDLDRIVFVG